MTGMFNVYQIYDYIGFNIGDDTVIRNSIFVNRYPANESNLPTRDTRSTNPETVQGGVWSLSSGRRDTVALRVSPTLRAGCSKKLCSGPRLQSSGTLPGWICQFHHASCTLSAIPPPPAAASCL